MQLCGIIALIYWVDCKKINKRLMLGKLEVVQVKNWKFGKGIGEGDRKDKIKLYKAGKLKVL